MSLGTWVTSVYDIAAGQNIVERATNICRDTGFEVDESGRRDGSQGRYHTVPIAYGNKSTNLLFNLEDSRDPDEPIFSFGKLVYPEKDDEDEEAIEAIFELVCRFATELDAAYVPLFHSEKRSMEVVPEDRPISDAVETPPRFGIYTDDVLEGLGGVEGLFDHEPWYVADLDGKHTLVIESESLSPWGDWRPPTDAPYIRSARFDESDVESQTGQSDGTGLSDPFADLAPGEYGTDVCVRQDDIAAEFRNDDLELVRVGVDEDRNLRLVGDDSFVRNVVVDGPDDNSAFIEQMLADVPKDADSADLMVSVLLNDAVPPAFVRADGPDDETVASRVVELNVSTNKIELLVSLGRALRADEDLDVATVESALDRLAEVEDPEEVQRFIETKLL